MMAIQVYDITWFVSNLRRRSVILLWQYWGLWQIGQFITWKM